MNVLYLIVCRQWIYRLPLCIFGRGPEHVVRTPPIYFVLYFPFCIWCSCITSLLLPRTLPYEPCCLMSHFLSFYAECTAWMHSLSFPKYYCLKCRENKILLITYSPIHFSSVSWHHCYSHIWSSCVSVVWIVSIVHCPVLPYRSTCSNTNE